MAGARIVTVQAGVQRCAAMLPDFAGERLRPRCEIELAAGFYRAACVVFAHELGLDARCVVEQRPQPRARRNHRGGPRGDGRVRHSGALARRLAFYLILNAFDLDRAALASVAGFTKQNASEALHDIEDRRERAVYDALINRVAHLLTGKDMP